MAKVIVKNGSNTICLDAEPGEKVSSVLAQTGFSIPYLCGGKHTCGKCRLRVYGECSEPTAEEIKLLSEEELHEGIRLACSANITGEAEIILEGFSGKQKILSDYKTISGTNSHYEGFGFAVDIGTTTVVVQLIRLADASVVAQSTEENCERKYGADVISRIEACSKGLLHEMSEAIRFQIESMAEECASEASVNSVRKSVITGNTTMLYIYEEIDPSDLAVYPFRVMDYFGRISQNTIMGEPVYLPRCISAYIGSDITCSVLGSELMHYNETELLADIGTNGEIVLKKGNQLLCCAAAAGPAFEGTGLCCGMHASTGAVAHVNLTDDGIVSLQIIDNATPIGICGSGIIDALDVMLRIGITDESGYLEDDYYLHSPSVRVAPADVRQIQLAKAAVAAGMLTLVEESGCSFNEVERFALAGGFGAALNPAAAANIGLIPLQLQDRMDYVGNAALRGAVQILCDAGKKEESISIASSADVVELSASKKFMDYYIDCMELCPVE